MLKPSDKGCEKMETDGVIQVKKMAYITAVCLLGDSFMYVALPIYWREVGLVSLWEVGVLLSVNRLIRLPLHPFIGWVYRSMSIRTGCIIAVVLAGISTVGYGVVHTFAGWFILRALWGVAWTLLRQGAYHVIFQVSDTHNSGQLSGMYNGLYRVGSLVGVLAGGLLTEYCSFTTIVTLFGLCTVPLILYMLCSRQNRWFPILVSKHKVQLISGENLSGLVTTQVATVVGTAFLIALLFQGIVTSSVSRLITTYIGSISWNGMIWGAAFLAGILHALRWGWEPWLSPYIGKKLDLLRNNYRNVALTIVLFSNVFLFWSITICNNDRTLLVLILIIQLSGTVVTTTMDVLLHGILTEQNRTNLIPAFALAVDIGAALGPLLAFIMTERQIFFISAGLLLIASCYWFFYSKRMNKSKQMNHTTIIEPK